MIQNLLLKPVSPKTGSPLLNKIEMLGNLIGNTPLRKLNFDRAELFVKLEYNNFSGSIKDRAVYNILMNGIKKGLINEETTLIESSSGNFAVSLASMCRNLGLKCIVVIDPNINNAYANQLDYIATKVIRVTERDNTGGYLLTRINTVQEYCVKEKNIFWTNQYENENNYMAYYHGLGPEICAAFDELDFVFIGVSTCGTIAGLSICFKERFPGIQIIAVDIEGSVIFGDPPAKRYISGLGASKVPPLLCKAMIDIIIPVSQLNIVKGSVELLQEQGIFGGASAGAMYYAAKSLLKTIHTGTMPKALFLCPDKGTAYLDNIYDKNWVTEKFYQK
jgi:N-(2-amino-2-carboxyethyl)-L-glutamate synthase